MSCTMLLIDGGMTLCPAFRDRRLNRLTPPPVRGELPLVAGALLGGLLRLKQVVRGVNQRDVGERLGKIAEHAAWDRIVLLRKKPDGE